MELQMIFATSDLHGYPLDAFLRLLETAGFGDSDILYVLGDVIDRNGDGGIAMLRWMMSRPNVELILGNHEAMMLSCIPWFDEINEESIRNLDLERMKQLLLWLRNGANPTIRSLKALKKAQPEAFADLADYVRDAPLYAAVSAGGRDFLLVHSGFGNFSPARKLSGYEPDELLWHRPSAEEVFYPDVLTVFGHTPVGYRFGEEGKMFRTETWIDIDTGAAGGGAPMLLRLDDLQPFYGEILSDGEA